MILLAKHILINKLWSELEQGIMIHKHYPLNEWVLGHLQFIAWFRFLLQISCVLFFDCVLFTIYL